ncbi:FAD-dependent thymidylate synthase [Lachnospira multipara]|uniref:Thymidylate synthase (FAD) n=1 Tax=Lachnospira multipara TaxID=28051 RepID=A0A1H5S5Z1_9FIRM|nr:FAD-dependent thymidylate synthase [Lachnospira multipara]SEF46032.1 thymidylate synthase (FAD) [Lachnospira multipara]
MGKIIIQEMTAKNPIQLMGMEAGVCWGGDTSDAEKNYKRGLSCINSGHGRVLEYPQVYMIIDGYSAKVIREFYTHIGGSPTRLQASTRYIDYTGASDFEYVMPPKIAANEEAKKIYMEAMKNINDSVAKLNSLDIAKEDSSMLLPLGMTTKVVFRTNLRMLIDMSHQRLCTRAFWEYRGLMNDIKNALADYSEEWKEVTDNYFKAKCEVSGYCEEAKSCGRFPKKQ